MKKQVAIVHFNTPELTEALVKSIRKHGGEEYLVYILDNSNERPFTKKMKGVKVFNNRKGQIIDFEKELVKYHERDEKIGCAKGCYFGSDVHMMSVQKLWELVPEGFMLMDSDILIKAPGGLMVYGMLIAVVNIITKGKAIKKKEFSCAGCPSAGVCNGGCASAEKEAK